MKAHDLARRLLEGPDLEVCTVSDHPASHDCEYIITHIEERELFWYRVTIGGVDEKHLFKGAQPLHHVQRMDAPSVKVLVLGGVADVEEFFPEPT